MAKQTGQWVFAPRAGGIEYVQDPSSGYFRDAPIPKLVRELLQNSLDSRDPNASGPVEVNFCEAEIAAQDIRAADLAKHVTACAKRIAQDEAPQHIARIYKCAGQALRKPTLRCLVVTDKNTTGLTDGKWKALVEQEGVVCKPSVGSPGGSNGIGKNAVFNLSDVRTVFYSTRFLGPKGRVDRMQGKAVLMAHNLRSKDLQHIGFHQSKNGPLIGPAIPTCFRLEHTGTGVFILGFNPRSNDWAAEVAAATVENFFYAIDRQQLVVNVRALNGDTQEVTHETIGMLFENPADGKQSDAAYYWKAIQVPKPVETERLDKLGPLSVFPDITGGPRRVAYINRNGMLISGSREQAVNPFSPRGKSLWPDYAVVVIPTTDAGDSWVRQMENPSHDSISPDQLPDEAERRRAKRVLNESRDAIRTIIDQKAETNKYGDSSNLSELATQIPELNPGAAGNRSLAVNTVLPAPAGHFPPSGPEAESPDPEPSPDPDPDPEPVPGPDPDPNPIPRRPKVRKGRLRFKSPRVIAGSEAETILAFTPVDEDAKTIHLSVLPTGSERDTSKLIPVVEAIQIEPPTKDGKTLNLPVEDGRVVLNATPNTRFCIRVRTEQPLHNTALALG